MNDIYKRVIESPVKKIALFSETIVEKKIIDGFINGIGRMIMYGSRQIRLLQSGLVASYFLLMVLGLIILFLIQMIS